MSDYVVSEVSDICHPQMNRFIVRITRTPDLGRFDKGKLLRVEIIDRYHDDAVTVSIDATAFGCESIALDSVLKMAYHLASPSRYAYGQLHDRLKERRDQLDPGDFMSLDYCWQYKDQPDGSVFVYDDNDGFVIQLCSPQAVSDYRHVVATARQALLEQLTNVS